MKLGADVPYCIMRGTVLAEGIGEILTPLAPMPEMLYPDSQAAALCVHQKSYMQKFDRLEDMPVIRILTGFLPDSNPAISEQTASRYGKCAGTGYASGVSGAPERLRKRC